MTYAEAVQYLQSLPRFPVTPSLDRMRALLVATSCNYTQLNYIHVTGTNGKGSTCAMLESIARAAGKQTGLFTSPHLERFNERIQINRKEIADEQLAEYIARLQPLVQPDTCSFEVVLAAALCYFCDQQVDVVVLEVGMGGRLDPTNIIPHSTSVITNIGMDHAEILGPTRVDIAREKAGLIKPNSICITTETAPEPLAKIQEVAKQQHATCISASGNDVEIVSRNVQQQVFNYKSYAALQTNLIGNHQFNNAVAALMCAETLGYSESAIRNGLRTAKWPLRFEVLATEPLVITDAGHNPHGLSQVVPLIQELFPSHRKRLILGCSYDKPYVEMAKLLATLTDDITLTQAAHGVDPIELQVALNNLNLPISSNVKTAVQTIIQRSAPDDLVLVLGGLYLAVEARRAMR